MTINRDGTFTVALVGGGPNDGEVWCFEHYLGTIVVAVPRPMNHSIEVPTDEPVKLWDEGYYRTRRIAHLMPNPADPEPPQTVPPWASDYWREQQWRKYRAWRERNVADGEVAVWWETDPDELLAFVVAFVKLRWV